MFLSHCFGILSQGCDDLSKSEEGLVDVDSFFQLLRVSDLASLFHVGLSFAACQVDQLKLRDDHVLRIFQVNLAHDESKDAMASAA